MTGKGPGRHGIIDFMRYDPERNRLIFNNNHEIRQKTIWQILSEKNYRVGSINVPMTFPPEKVNGFMISGFDTPSGQDFTYPKELQSEILSRYPDYTHEKKWERKVNGGDSLFAQNLEYISQSFDRGYDLARFCGDKYGWDVLMVLFKLVDNLQHKAWRYLDPRTADRDPARRDLTIKCFERLDQVLGKLRGLAEEHEATIFIMSDHGHGSLDGKAQPNLLLSQWGYLGLRNNFSRMKTRGATWWRRLTRSKNGSMGHAGTLDQDLAFDWTQTRACVLHAGIYGFLYINLKGRQPAGIVDPSEYKSLREEIQKKLLAATCRDRDGKTMQIFSDVFVTEDLYGCDREQFPWMPDLLLAPANGLAVVKKIRGRQPVRWIALNRLEGTHRLEGVFVANGPAIRAGKTIVNARIADLAPTLLAGLGERVPQDMEGRVIRELFSQPVTVEYEPPKAREKTEEHAPVLSRKQLEEVADRLGDLGYLD
jgi:predicted AlkP superfamily phosphohydrolase/phosphomutase